MASLYQIAYGATNIRSGIYKPLSSRHGIARIYSQFLSSAIIKMYKMAGIINFTIIGVSEFITGGYHDGEVKINVTQNKVARKWIKREMMLKLRTSV